MNRRDFIHTMGILSAGLALPGARRVFAEAAETAGWRTFEVTTHIEVLKRAGQTRVWAPGAVAHECRIQIDRNRDPGTPKG